jgi:polyphosphate kinase 2 (PPK2 family)
LEELDELQNLLFVESKYSLLIVIRGWMSGKDPTIRHVFGHLNPQDVMVQSFKVPTALELSQIFVEYSSAYTCKRNDTNI